MRKGLKTAVLAKERTITGLKGSMVRLRERVKVQRGWESPNSVLAEGNKLQHNFVKPHMALGGKTPAEISGLNVKGWKRLLELAATKSK
jgi:hypothetical protein